MAGVLAAWNPRRCLLRFLVAVQIQDVIDGMEAQVQRVLQRKVMGSTVSETVEAYNRRNTSIGSSAVSEVIGSSAAEVVAHFKSMRRIVSEEVAHFKKRFVGYKARMVVNNQSGYGFWFLCLDDEVAHYEDGFRRVEIEWMRYLSDLSGLEGRYRRLVSEDGSSGGATSNTRKRPRGTDVD